MYIIKDLEGCDIKITDIEGGLAMIAGFLSYTRHETLPSLQRLEDQRLAYWQDLYDKLIALMED